MSIPKVIHYCWFGGNPFSEKEEMCISSWKKYCPDYEIKRWDETNFDVMQHPFTKNAFEKKKWAFLSDFARLQIIYRYGGIYMDTDVELIKPLDDLLQLKAFIGRECENFTMNPGLCFGAEAQTPIIGDFLDVYERQDFGCEGERTRYEIIPIPLVITEYLRKREPGFVVADKEQEFFDLHIFPVEYFCPQNCYTGKTQITERTYSIHHFVSSWKSDEEKKSFALYRKCVNLFGEKIGQLVCVAIHKMQKLAVKFGRYAKDE